MAQSRRRVEHEPAFVLHSYPYKETSLIIEAFSRRQGRTALLAKGARRPRSAMRGVLHAFQPLRLSWTGSGELNTLVGAEWEGGMPFLRGFGLMCGFYVNELILRLLPRDDAHEALFDAYAGSLARLGRGEPTAGVLRGFEKRLLAELGYAMLLDRDAASGAPIDPAMHYLYDPERGPLPVNGGAGGEMVVRGSTLLDLDRDEFASAETLHQSRGLMRALIGQRLHGQTLHTRSVLLELQDL
ncbi:MAG: DNA repair protein RecO [Proteobacteria bacterium]|nr:DNA repair protein RecO [Pseudomonadota bacterium]